MSKFYNELDQYLKQMKPRQRGYEAIKLELLARNRWKYRKRGNPKLGWLRMMEHKARQD